MPVMFRIRENGLPVLSRKEIDRIGETVIYDYDPETAVVPKALDVDRFVTRYLGMTQDYRSLSHCGVYLGMTVFNDTDRIPVYDPLTKRAVYISAKAGTMIIDSSLLSGWQERRYRFTVCHEAAHGILHRTYFQRQADTDPKAALYRCRVCRVMSGKEEMTDEDWMEWQANRLASALLMPRGMAEKALEQVPSYDRDAQQTCLMQIFRVSREAADCRLEDLGYHRKRAHAENAYLTGYQDCCTDGSNVLLFRR